MGRKRLFDEDKVLQQAMLLFWREGYDNTTFTRLEELTGVTGRSLINCFGDKDALFERALIAYVEMAKSILQNDFARPGLKAIQGFFDNIEREPDESPRQCGCLICNSLFEVGMAKPSVAEQVNAIRDELIAYFKQSLQADGIAQAQARAEFLVSIFWGSVAEIKRSGSTKALKTTNATLKGLLASWQA